MGRQTKDRAETLNFLDEYLYKGHDLVIIQVSEENICFIEFGGDEGRHIIITVG